MKRTLPVFLILSLLLSCEREPATVSVTGISVSPTQLTLILGNAGSLSANVLPSDATDKTVFWSSSDPSVASVSEGTVTALGEGSAEILAKTKDGGFQAACKVTVKSALKIDPGQNLKPVFDEKGGTASVSFVTTDPWTATLLGDKALDWLRIEPPSGNAGAGTVKFTVSENTGFEERSASVRIQCREVFETVVITQKQKDDLTVTASKFEVGAEGGRVNIEVKANVDYTYSVDGDWITPLTTRSYESRTLVFTVTRNETIRKREGSITFSGGGFSETVRIYQDGETPTILLSENSFTIHQHGGSFLVTVRSNVDFTVEMPVEAPWIKNITTRSLSSHSFRFEVEGNSGYYERSARILFTDKDNGLSEAVTVTQQPEEGFDLAEKEMTVSEKGGTFEIHCTSNINYRFSIEGDWIKESPDTRGQTVESAHRFLAEPLPDDEAYRMAWIVFSDERQGIYRSVAVIQSEDSPVIIDFKDPRVKERCIYNWDRNGDKELSKREASLVKDLNIWLPSTIQSFDELVYFTGIETIPPHFFERFSELTSISFPPGLHTIGKCAFRWCDKLAIPVFPDSLKEIGEQAFYQCSGFTGELILPPGLEILSGFNGCTGLTGVRFPKQLKIIGHGAFDDCSGLTTITLPESLKELGAFAFSGCSGLNKVILLGEIPPECDYYSFQGLNCLIYVPTGTARTYYDAPCWKPYRRIVTEEGHLPSEFYYASTDYSRDGEVLCLQKATKGNGINIVFLGDGYTDKDMAPGGEYETIMRRWMEQFFIYEPYKSFRDWFSVYTVKVVSKHEIFNSIYAERRLSRDFTEVDDLGNGISAFDSVIQEYADRAPVSSGQPRRVAVFHNSDESVGRSFCMMSSSGGFTAWVFNNIDARPTVLNHEAGGHGFGWLGDEYTEFERAPENPQESLERYYKWGKWGAFKNLDWRSDPGTVLWSRFLTDSRYAGEGLGVYEGGMRYSKGIYRPTINSLMASDYEKGAVFNAPSREAIYKSIMRWGVGVDWEYDYEGFVKADEAGRKQAAEAYAMYPPTRSYVERRENFEPGLPPIMIDDSVREIRVTKDGKVTLIR